MINGKNDPRIQRIRNLLRREERDKRGQFLVDGIRFVFQAIKSGAKIETVFYAPKVLTGPFGRSLVESAAQHGAACLPVPPDIYYGLAPSREPQGMMAVINGRCGRLRDQPAAGGLWVALEEVQSPGNFGTIVRSSEAAGATGVILFGDRIDPFDPAAIRATMGALFFQKIVRTSIDEFECWKRMGRIAVIGTSPKADCDFRMVDYCGPIVLFMGSERHGLSDIQRHLCDRIVRIPMAGKSDSLNLATATAIMLYEAYRQRNPVCSP